MIPFKLSHLFLGGLIFSYSILLPSLRAQRLRTSESNALPVRIQSAAVKTEITGRIAVTTLDLVFHNPNGRVLEGTFEFPLLENQTVVRFALDIGGQLREAVPVAKDRGRVVFEEIERRGVDPGLLEKTQGNNYRARIYPLPPRGTRHVVIAYQEDILRADTAATYRLALDFPERLERFQLSLLVNSGNGTAPKVQTNLPLELPTWRDARLLEVQRENFSASGFLEVELPKIDHANVATEHRGDTEYFYAEAPLPKWPSLARPAPHAVGLLWDASASGLARDHAREFALLAAWFARVPNVEISLRNFRDHVADPIRFSIRNGDWSKLRTTLEETVYDGATSLDGLRDDPSVGEWLLFTDGLFNYGKTPAAEALALRAPVHAIVSSARANPALLRGMANRHQGEFVNLFELSAAAATQQLRNYSLRVLQIDHHPQQLAQVFPERNVTVQGQTLVVGGILRSDRARIRLRVGHNESDAQEVEVLLRAGENAGTLAARAWAAQKIAALDPEFEKNKEDIRRTSEAFGIVTAGSSLIVLETLQDYLRYDIMPPAELREAWDSNRQMTASAQQKGRDAQLDRIANLFSERKKWWETEFPKKRFIAEKDKIEGAGDTMVAAPVPPRSVGALSRSAAPADGEVRMEQFSVNGPVRSRMEAPAVFDTVAGLPAGAEMAIRNSASSAGKGESSGVAGPVETSISLRPWAPQAGYLDRLGRAQRDEQLSIYIEERPEHAAQPGFFLDVAEFFFAEKNSEIALRVLSNLAELQLEDPGLLRVLANRLVQAKRPDLAEPLFEHVFAIRPEDPQSRRDLALNCAALQQYQRAVDLLWSVVEKPWDARFPEIEMIALGEMNAIVATCGETLDLSKIDSRLRQNLPVGLRAVLTWDTDNCDIDLWVDDPSGERAVYNHPRTRQGGRMSQDFTSGYGPEEFLLREPKDGKYTVRINYYSDRRQTAIGPVTAHVRLITGFGTAAQLEQLLTVRLVDKKETLEIGAIEIRK